MTRLEIAVQLAKSIEPPFAYVGKEETNKSYSDWAKKLFKMADKLIKQSEK